MANLRQQRRNEQQYSKDIAAGQTEEDTRHEKQRADTRRRMAKLRQSQSKEQIFNTNRLQNLRREKQRQQEYSNNIAAEQIIIEQAMKRYV
jgi:hypothetical protein